jgi:hypothetical protein
LRPGRSQLCDNAGKQVVQTLLAAQKQHVRVARLRGPRSALRLRREGVALQNGDVIEVSRQSARGRQPAHARADDDSLATHLDCHGGLLVGL